MRYIDRPDSQSWDMFLITLVQKYFNSSEEQFQLSFFLFVQFPANPGQAVKNSVDEPWLAHLKRNATLGVDGTKASIVGTYALVQICVIMVMISCTCLHLGLHLLLQRQACAREASTKCSRQWRGNWLGRLKIVACSAPCPTDISSKHPWRLSPFVRQTVKNVGKLTLAYIWEYYRWVPTTSWKIMYLSSETVIFGVHQPNDAGVSRTLFRHFQGTVRQQPENFVATFRQVGFEDTCKTFQITFKRCIALKTRLGAIR